MEDLEIILFTLNSNCKTKNECDNLEIEIKKLFYNCKEQRLKELFKE